MDSEMIRDQIFAISGLLNPVMGGKSVKPPQPAKLWEIVAMPFSYPRVYEPDQGGGSIEGVFTRSGSVLSRRLK